MRFANMPVAVLATMLFSITPALAQDTCGVKSTLTKTAKGGRFVYNVSCGDGESDTIFVCTKGGKTIAATLPVAPFDAKAGARFQTKFTIGGKKLVKTLTVASPAKAGGSVSAAGATIVLNESGQLWWALAKVDNLIDVENKSYTTSIGIASSEAATFGKFKRACGL